MRRDTSVGTRGGDSFMPADVDPLQARASRLPLPTTNNDLPDSTVEQPDFLQIFFPKDTGFPNK